MLPNPNLLHNWYLVDPIDQRMEQIYTDGYGIDCWRVSTAEMTAIRSIPKTRIKKLGESSHFFQTIEPKLDAYLIGKKVTVSVLTPQGLYSKTGTIPAGNFNWNTAIGATGFAFGMHRQDDDLHFRIYDISSTAVGAYVDVLAVKLELGAHQTLAHQGEDGAWILNDPPPNKALELTKCQRYQITMFSSNDVATSTSAGFAFAHNPTAALATIYVPTNLRTAPAVKFNSCDLRSMSDGNIFYPITSMTVARVSGNAVKLNIICSGGGLTTGEIYLISKSEDGFLIFDANL